MFKKLRLKLTIINLSIMLALFSLLIIGTYYFSQAHMTRHTRIIAHKITDDIQSGLLTDIPDSHFAPHRFPPYPGPPPDRLIGPLSEPESAPRPAPSFFFLKTDSTGAITFQSTGHSLPIDQLSGLTAEILQTGYSEGTILFDQVNYAFFLSPLIDQSGSIIVLHDLTQDRLIQQVQMTSLILVGIVCSLLSFGASFFMAQHAMIPIQKAWRQQKCFLSDASHELRTPLAVIRTNLEIVRENQAETVASQNKWLDNIEEESTAMAKLVDSLFFLARTDSQQQPLDKQPFSLHSMLNRAVSPFEALAAAKGVSLQTLDSVPLQYYGDETRLKQVINILLDNAIRHTPAGGNITVSLSPQDAKAILTISDSGEGIEQEHLDKIFNRFYQIDNARTKGGAGLGLAIAKWIIENHGGLITVTSTVGEGTTFIIYLPYQSA